MDITASIWDIPADSKAAVTIINMCSDQSLHFSTHILLFVLHSKPDIVIFPADIDVHMFCN